MAIAKFLNVGICPSVLWFRYTTLQNLIPCHLATLSRCTPVATADEIDPGTLVRPVWGSRWTLPEAREILIGPKNDDFCFVVFPGDDSVRKIRWEAATPNYFIV